MATEKIDPIIFENPETGENITLEFNRRTAKACERETGLNPSTLRDKLKDAPLDSLSNLFYYALQMHHADEEWSIDDTDELLFDKIGIPDGFIERLAAIFVQPWTSMQTEVKNSKWVMK